MARFPVTRAPVGEEVPEMEETRPGKPMVTELVQDLSEALDALLGILTMVQDSGMLPDNVATAMDELVAAAEKASAALDQVVREAPSQVSEEEHVPSRPVLKMPVRRGDNRSTVTFARTPNYGLEEL